MKNGERIIKQKQKTNKHRHVLLSVHDSVCVRARACVCVRACLCVFRRLPVVLFFPRCDRTEFTTRKLESVRAVYVDDDDELMLNVLRCHETY